MFNHVDLKVSLQELHAETTEKGRFYTTPDNKIYPSVTTVLSISNKDGIDKWKKRVGEEEAERVKFQAGGRGTEVHTIAENYLNNKEDWKKGIMPVNLHSFLKIKPILDECVDNIWFQEAPLYSDYLKVAGRVDCIAEYKGKLSVIDFKTSRKVKKLEYVKNYFMQESVYAVAFEERTGVPINQLVTIISVDNEQPQVYVESRNNHIHDFIRVRASYRDLFGY